MKLHQGQHSNLCFINSLMKWNTHIKFREWPVMVAERMLRKLWGKLRAFQKFQMKQLHIFFNRWKSFWQFKNTVYCNNLYYSLKEAKPFLSIKKGGHVLHGCIIAYSIEIEIWPERDLIFLSESCSTSHILWG